MCVTLRLSEEPVESPALISCFHLPVVVTALIEGLHRTAGSLFPLGGGGRRPQQAPPVLPADTRLFQEAAGLRNHSLRPPTPKHTNTPGEANRVISRPLLCQKYMVTDAHKQILIIPPEGSNYSPKWVQQKPSHEDTVCDSLHRLVTLPPSIRPFTVH